MDECAAVGEPGCGLGMEVFGLEYERGHGVMVWGWLYDGVVCRVNVGDWACLGR